MKFMRIVALSCAVILITISCTTQESESPSPPDCIHPETHIHGHPFGINLDPLRKDQLNTSWDTIFNDIDFIRGYNPFLVRITLRAQWIQTGADYAGGELTVYYDRSEGSYYDQVSQIYGRCIQREGPVEIMAILYGTPEFNSEDTSFAGVPLDVEVWRDFVATMLDEFPSITLWEIWNEPDLYYSWHGNVQQFVDKIYLPALEIINSAGSSKTVIAPAWAQNNHSYYFLPTEENPYPMFGWLGDPGEYEPDLGDLKDYYSLIGGINAFDIWGIHGYANYAQTDIEWSYAMQDYACQWDLWLQELSGSSYNIIEFWATEIGVDNKPGGHSMEDASDFYKLFIDDQFLSYNYYMQGYDGEIPVNGPDPYINSLTVYELYDEFIFDPEGGFSGIFIYPSFPKPAAYTYRDKIDEYYYFH